MASTAAARPAARKSGLAGLKPVGFALVGLGRAGTFHRAALRRLAGLAQLLWVVDADADLAAEMARLEGCQGTTDFQRALADPAVSAVIVASTTDTHLEYIMASLQAGKAVFTEKPVSHDPADLRAAIELALSKNVLFKVGYQRRVDRNFAELQRQVVSEQALGKLRIIKCTSRDNPLPPIDYLRRSHGLFKDMLCHDFDMIHFLCGELPEEVHTFGHAHDERVREMDDIDMVCVQMRFASGLLATVDCSRIAEYGYDQRVEVLGEKGMCTAQNEPTHTVVMSTSEGHLHSAYKHSFPERYHEAYMKQMEGFVALLREGRCEPESELRRHILTERLCAAAELSHRLGRAVKLADVDELRCQLPH